MATAPQQFCVRWNSYHTNLQTVFPRLLLTEQFADVTLACESRQLRCHKLVLSACSAYLERLLVQNPCKHPIVLMKDMRFSEMQALVDFMYKGEVNVTQEELPSLLKSAEALQIRGLCSSDTNGLSDLMKPQDSKQFAAATEALVANAHKESSSHNGQNQQSTPQTSHKPSKKRKCSDPRPDIKEEAVEEDGLYYGDLEHHTVDYNEDEDSEKPGSSLGQTSVINPYLRVKPESELIFQTKLQNLAKSNSDYLQRLTHMSPQDIRKEFSKYGLNTDELPSTTDNDFYKSWLEQNGELEVSLLRANEKKRQKEKSEQRNEVDLITKSKVKPLEAMRSEFLQKTSDIFQYEPPVRRRGRPPIFKEKNAELNETVLKSDLDQFLEGKEVSSSGLSRKELERIMMGKFNPNRRYSNEAMWAALMDVKKGGSIYRAAQTHKVPRKSLRNWMKRCHIKSSFPMPQQLKQFVENSKRQKEYKNYDQIHLETQNTENTDALQALETHDIDFGKHFLTYNSNQVSSDDDVVAELPSNDDVIAALPSNEDGKQDGADQTGAKKNDSALNMSLHE